MEFCGKKMGKWELRDKLINGTRKETDALLSYLVAENKLKAEKRMEREKDPDKKYIMRQLILQGEYNFDFIFGPEG